MSNKSLVETLKENAMEGALSGAIACAGASMFYGLPLTEKIYFLNQNVPIGVVVGGTVALAVASSEFISDELIARIPQLQSIASTESKIAPVAVSGLSTYILFRSFISSDTSIMNSVLLGSGSAIAGKYANSIIYNYNM